jgi:hypothetical protein
MHSPVGIYSSMTEGYVTIYVSHSLSGRPQPKLAKRAHYHHQHMMVALTNGLHVSAYGWVHLLTVTTHQRMMVALTNGLYVSAYG